MRKKYKHKLLSYLRTNHIPYVKTKKHFFVDLKDMKGSHFDWWKNFIKNINNY